MDLWQLRSHSATSPRVRLAMKMMRLELEVPLVTVYERWEPNTRAAYFSLSPIGPL